MPKVTSQGGARTKESYSYCCIVLLYRKIEPAHDSCNGCIIFVLQINLRLRLPPKPPTTHTYGYIAVGTSKFIAVRIARQTLECALLSNPTDSPIRHSPARCAWRRTASLIQRERMAHHHHGRPQHQHHRQRHAGCLRLQLCSCPSSRPFCLEAFRPHHPPSLLSLLCCVCRVVWLLSVLVMVLSTAADAATARVCGVVCGQPPPLLEVFDSPVSSNSCSENYHTPGLMFPISSLYGTMSRYLTPRAGSEVLSTLCSVWLRWCVIWLCTAVCWRASAARGSVNAKRDKKS